MKSRAPEYSEHSELPPPKDPQTLAAIAGEPVPAPAPTQRAGAAAAPSNSGAAVTASLPRLPGTPELLADGSYAFSGAGIELAVDPKRAGTAVRLSLDGKSVLAAPAPEQTAYSAEIQGSTLLLKSPDGSLSLRYRLDTGRRCVDVSYTLSNAAGETVHARATQTHAVALNGGLSFFPNPPQAPLLWVAHQPPRALPPLQATLSVGQSWVASAGDGVLFVVTFPDPAPTTLTVASQYDAKSKQHPWWQLSAQSASFELPPGTFATWNVRWLLRHLPPGLAVKSGNPELVGFVKGVIQ